MKVHLRRGDDWQELLVDGKVVLEGHSLPLPEVLRKLGIEVTTSWVEYCRWCSEPHSEGSLDSSGVCYECVKAEADED